MNLINSLTITILVLFLVSCATAKKVMTPNGTPGYSIECNGTGVSMTVCYEKAAEVCKNGYNIIDTHDRSGFVANQYYFGGTSHKGIFIECK